MDWYKVWQENHLFAVEKNLLKKRKYIYTPCIKVNQDGFQNADVRKEIYADTLARYYRYCGDNVMYAPSFDTICYSSFMESKIENNELNDLFYDTYNNELVALNVGYSPKKAINLRSSEALLFIQRFFLFLYNNGIIKYKEKSVLENTETNKIYDGIETTYKEKRTTKNVFTLEIEKYIDRFLYNLERLPIDDSLKNEFISKLDKQDLLELSFFTESNFEFKLLLEEPELLGSLGALVINPNYMDILDYVAPEEIFAVENFLERRNKKYLFTGNTFTNPLNGNQIPIFISLAYKEAKKPLFGYNSDDAIILKELGIEPVNIVVDGVLVNSDFLDGMDLKSAHNRIIDDFSSYEIGNRVTKYLKKDIVISSLDKYGCPFPLMTNGSNIITLEEHLPLTFSSRFRIIVPGESNISSEYHLFSGSLNNLFIHAILPYMAILGEKAVEIDEPLAPDNIKEVKEWLKNALLIVNRNDAIYDLFMPLMLLSIVEKAMHIDFESTVEVLTTNSVYDGYGNTIKKEYNNLVKMRDLVSTYGSDAIRLYYLDTDISKPMYFDKDSIFKYKQFLLNIEARYSKSFLDNNFDMEFPFYQFKNKAYDALVGFDLPRYVKTIFEFVKENEDLMLTKKQALEFLIIISIVAPDLAESLHYKYFSSKQLLIDYGWVL